MYIYFIERRGFVAEIEYTFNRDVAFGSDEV